MSKKGRAIQASPSPSGILQPINRDDATFPLPPPGLKQSLSDNTRLVRIWLDADKQELQYQVSSEKVYPNHLKLKQQQSTTGGRDATGPFMFAVDFSNSTVSSYKGDAIDSLNWHTTVIRRSDVKYNLDKLFQYPKAELYQYPKAENVNAEDELAAFLFFWFFLGGAQSLAGVDGGDDSDGSGGSNGDREEDNEDDGQEEDEDDGEEEDEDDGEEDEYDEEEERPKKRRKKKFRKLATRRVKQLIRSKIRIEEEDEEDEEDSN